MNTLENAYLEEQNKLAAGGAWIILVTITTTGYVTPLRFTNNNSDVVWPTVGGNTYSRAALALDDVDTSLDGKFSEFKLRIGEQAPSGDIRARIRATAGLVGSIVRIRIVHSDHLDLDTAAVDESAEILSCELDLNAVTFTLGVPSLATKRFPRDRYVPGFCRHKFGGALCQYAQPDYTFTSNLVTFTLGVQDAANPVNSIWIGDTDIVTALFKYATPTGVAQGSNWALAKDTGFTVSGTVSNDGFFLADRYYAVQPHLVYVVTEGGGAQEFTNETCLTGVTFQLGYAGCDHTLEACQLRDNTQNYGGSPGLT